MDSFENIYVCGKYLTDVVFDSDTLYGSLSRHHTFILKYDSAGNLIWSLRGEGNQEDVPTDMCVDNSGNIYLTGWFSSDTLKFGNYTLPKIGGKENLVTIKMDSSGSVIWAHNIGPFRNITSKSIAVDKAGNSFVTGTFQDMSINIGGTSLTKTETTLLSTDIFIIKYSQSGNIIWAQKAGGNDEDDARSIATDKNGNFYISGVSSSSTIIFNNLTLKSVSDTIPFRISYQDAFIAKYDANGNALWCRSEGGEKIDRTRAVAVDKDGNNYAFMESQAGPGVDRFIEGQKLSTIAQTFLICRDSTGKLQWVQEIVGDIWANSIAIDDSKNSLIAGGYWSYLYWGNDTVVFDNVVDFYVAKIGNILPASVHNSISIQPYLKVYPNPSSGVFSIITEKESQKIKIYDITGKQIFDANPTGKVSKIDMSIQPKGVYFIIVDIDDMSSIRRIALE